jgi:hypothetical protein
MIIPCADAWADTPLHALLASNDDERLLMTVPAKYALVCLDCHPDWPGLDLDRTQQHPASTAVHHFADQTQRQAWIDEHQSATGHPAFWTTTLPTTRAERAAEAAAQREAELDEEHYW